MLRDEIQHERRQNAGLLEAFNLNSQAVKLTKRTSDKLILVCKAIRSLVGNRLDIQQSKKSFRKGIISFISLHV